MLWWIDSIKACETRVRVERYFFLRINESTREPHMLKRSRGTDLENKK